MTDWPKTEPVTLDEAIEMGDGMIADAGGLDPSLGRLSGWVEAENARRAQAKVEFEAADVEVAGVTLQVGKVYHLTVTSGYRGAKARRLLNCVFRGQRLGRSWGSTHHSLSFTQYGANPKGYPSTKSLAPKEVTAVEPVETPDWVRAKAKETARWDAEIAAMVGGDDDED